MHLRFALKKLTEFLRPNKLTPVKFNTLILIKHKGIQTGLAQNEVGQHLIISPSNMTALLDKLIDDGYVNRHQSETDRPVSYIRITKQG